MENYLPAIKGPLEIETLSLRYPVEDLFAGLAELPEASFLNSSMITDAGRYSFIGINPFLIFRAKKNRININIGGHEICAKDDPFNALARIINSYRIKNPSPFPFSCGGIGYFSYDLKDVLEKLPSKAADDLNVHDIYFVFYQAVLVFDRLSPGHINLCVLNIPSQPDKNPSKVIRGIKHALKNPRADTWIAQSAKHSQALFESNFTKKSYIESVKKIIDYIRSGDIYQACLSQRFKTRAAFSAYELYRRLNAVNPSPFSAFLNFDKLRVISSSPELFLKVADNTVETRPMKGTLARRGDPSGDKEGKDKLQKSEKDAAELSMVVDLERNDLGKICVPGSVEVTEHRRIETYPTVFQTISIIRGELEKDIGLTGIIKACFPGGSISGCPKIRAMEIIEELEPVKRGIYTGSIGYISFHGTMELNIAIRTMVEKNNDIYFQSGGGIVADSDPEAEYNETLDKARAMAGSLGIPFFDRE
ncbi:MAG: aminodeoxychorismate synthase component I [Candidatus Omnitrophota bacterium]